MAVLTFLPHFNWVDYTKLNIDLYEKLGVVYTQIKEFSEEVDANLISNCGAVQLSVPIKTAKEKWTSSAAIIDFIGEASVYEKSLKDKDYGKFTKSQLFNQINNCIIIPTQILLGNELYGCASGSEINYIDEQVYLSDISDYQAEGEHYIEEIYCVMPSSGELRFINYPKKPLFSMGLSQITLDTAVKGIYDILLDTIESLVLDMNANYINIPTDIVELVKYYRFVGIAGGKAEYYEG